MPTSDDPSPLISLTEEESSATDQRRAKFCLMQCPGCKAARKKQKGFWYQAVRVSDDKLCPWCSAYTRATGRKAYEPIPEADEDD
jgi:hypothetical protein